MKLSPGERVLEMVEAHMEEADMFERRGQTGQAELIRSLAADYQKVVNRAAPEWISLHDAQAAKGWSARWWRQRCQELEGEDGARKRSGQWEIHRTAFEKIQRKPQHHEVIDTDQDLRALAAELAQD